MLNILFIGDIVGRPGRRAVKELVRDYRKKYKLDLVIANGENAAGGNGITKAIADELYDNYIDIITMGNHTWDKKEIFEFIDHEQYLIRPANYPPETPGRGYGIIKVKGGIKVAVMNLSGRVFLPPLDCPFRKATELLDEIKRETKISIIDFHAEATSEKVAFGWYMDGLVSAVIGTHTHIQTADERILPQGTAYITDAGMTGPRDSVLGVEREMVIKKFISQMPVRFETAKGDSQLNGILLEINEVTGKTESIKRIQDYI